MSKSEDKQNHTPPQGHSPLHSSAPQMHTEAMNGLGNSRVLEFPRPAVDGAKFWQIWCGRMWVLLGKTANRLRIGGCVQPIVMDDPVTGQHLGIRLGPLFTVVSVDGRDYYFRRFSGKYDGAGTGCSNQPFCCTPGYTSRSNSSLPGPYHRSEKRPRGRSTWICLYGRAQ